MNTLHFYYKNDILWPKPSKEIEIAPSKITTMFWSNYKRCCSYKPGSCRKKMFKDMHNLLMSDVCNFREGENYVAKTREDRFKIFREAKILPHMFPTQIVISLLAMPTWYPFYGKKL